MKLSWDRRSFFQLLLAALTCTFQEAHAQSEAAAPRLGIAMRSGGRKNFVALQVKPFSWVDEGVDRVLDNLQEKGNVNTIFAYTFDYEEMRLKKNGSPPLPDHGVEGGPLVGGSIF